jgi:hypothetical protein
MSPARVVRNHNIILPQINNIGKLAGLDYFFLSPPSSKDVMTEGIEQLDTSLKPHLA